MGMDQRINGSTDQLQEALCGDEGMLKFLVAAYLTKPRLPPRDGYEEPKMAVPCGRQL